MEQLQSFATLGLKHRQATRHSTGPASSKRGAWHHFSADITFDFDTYLLTPAKAKALKQPTSHPPAPQSPSATTPAARPPDPFPRGKPLIPMESSAATETSVVWQGELKREQWNLFSLKVLTRLAQSSDLDIEVKVRAKLKDAATLEQVNAALKELGIDDPFRADPS